MTENDIHFFVLCVNIKFRGKNSAGCERCGRHRPGSMWGANCSQRTVGMKQLEHLWQNKKKSNKLSISFENERRIRYRFAHRPNGGSLNTKKRTNMGLELGRTMC